MVEHADPSKFGSSMSSCLPLLVFHHHPDGQEDNEDEMLMFSISKQSLHRNMERGHVSAGMCWTTPQGWILLARARDQDAAVSSACLWNPSTGDKLPLPDIITEEHEIPYHNKCMLSHKATRTQLTQDASSCSSVMKHLISGTATPLVTTARTAETTGDITRTTSVTVHLYQSHQRGKRPVAVSVLSRKSSPTWLPSEGKSTSAIGLKTCAP